MKPRKTQWEAPTTIPKAVICNKCGALVGRATGKGGAWIGKTNCDGYFLCLPCLEASLGMKS